MSTSFTRLYERYLNDPEFHALVDTLDAVIRDIEKAPSHQRKDLIIIFCDKILEKFEGSKTL